MQKNIIHTLHIRDTRLCPCDKNDNLQYKHCCHLVTVLLARSIPCCHLVNGSLTKSTTTPYLTYQENRHISKISPLYRVPTHTGFFIVFSRTLIYGTFFYVLEKGCLFIQVLYLFRSWKKSFIFSIRIPGQEISGVRFSKSWKPVGLPTLQSEVAGQLLM